MNTRTSLNRRLPAALCCRKRYLIGKVLGQGGFGITYMGYDSRLETAVCIKEFFPSGGAVRNADGSSRVYWSGAARGRRSGMDARPS